jgi:integrase
VNCSLSHGAASIFYNATMKIERSLEQIRTGLKFKEPKTKTSKRTITLPAMAIEALRAHRRAQLETRMALGQGRPDADTLVFSDLQRNPIPSNKLSRDWVRFVRSRKMPRCSLHSLRHSHASALIAKSLDIVTISKRLGHKKPTVTLAFYEQELSRLTP